MSIAIGDVGAPIYQSFAPRFEVETIQFAKLYVRTPLPHTRAAHTREVRFPGSFQFEATIQKVIPTIPFQQSCCIHRTDEIANTERCSHEDFLSSDAVEFGNGKIGQLVRYSVHRCDQLSFAQTSITARIDLCK